MHSATGLYPETTAPQASQIPNIYNLLTVLPLLLTANFLCPYSLICLHNLLSRCSLSMNLVSGLFRMRFDQISYKRAKLKYQSARGDAILCDIYRVTCSSVVQVVVNSVLTHVQLYHFIGI